MIRGAIAFGLVLRLDNTLINREVIITTSLWLVIASTLLFGSLLPILSKFLLETGKEDFHSHKQDNSSQEKNSADFKKMNQINSKEDEELSSIHEMVFHPNFDENEINLTAEPKKKENS
jgi:hypothetical protein